MKKNYCHISVVLDRSGSMGCVRDSTIEGFNSFVTKQRLEDGEATISLSQFDDYHDDVYSFVDLKTSPLLDTETFVPRGCTALYDAVGRSIVNTGEKLAGMTEDERPEKVLFVILTDGYENASKEYNLSKIKKMIEHQESKYKWEFVFIGANINAEEVGAGMGISYDKSITFSASARGVDTVFASLSSNVSSYRNGGTSAAYAFSSMDKKAQEDIISGS